MCRTYVRTIAGNYIFALFDCTTGRRVFAEGLKPSAKALQPSAKDLPRAALGEEPSGKKTSAKESLPRAFYRALGKVFAEG